jgi:Uma2 family endonuclease
MIVDAMPATAALPEQRVLLHDISWETYERLLQERGHSPGTRFFYDEGELEIMVVYIGHEEPNRTLAALAEITALETALDFIRAGGTTFKREDLAKGFEPDSSYYFRQASLVRGKREIDLAIDPPPELVIEVDITRSSLNRFPIFAAIGAPEVWRYDGDRVHFHALEGKEHRLIEESVVLPLMTASQATNFIELSRRETAATWDRAVRDWIRSRP